MLFKPGQIVRCSVKTNVGSVTLGDLGVVTKAEGFYTVHWFKLGESGFGYWTEAGIKPCRDLNHTWLGRYFMRRYE